MGGVKYESARWRKRTEKFQQDPCIGVYRLCVKVHFFTLATFTLIAEMRVFVNFFFCQSVSQPFINSVWHTLSWFLAQFVIQRVRKAVRQSSN